MDLVNVTMYHTYFNLRDTMGFARVLTSVAANLGNWNPLFGCGFPGSTPNGISCPASDILYAPMALGPGVPNTVYFGSDRLYRSADQGGNGIPDVPVNAFVIDPGNTQILYAGTDIGVFASNDGGANWVPYTTGIPRVPVFDLTLFNGATRVLRAATYGRGIWERTPLSVPVSLQGFEVK